ncbi:MAG: DUF1848 domain-containing protein [Desulfobacula sp.]|jgi:hypothetical protein|nr:DUF1848 domain-containing protein [Desulfobacula sp.]MBT6337793.1 DUF1848 domain-containing protein [Desulfobacula sp.]MBT7260561.1 DUF1848 domain-containing protein [Desulfobacula sp.]
MIEKIPAESIQKDLENDQVVEQAYQHLKGIFIKHFQNAMLEVGQYLINKMYNGNYELAQRKEPGGTKSLAKLYKKIQLDSQKNGTAPSRTWLYDSVNLAIDHHIFENHKLSSVYGRLGHSHKVNLTYATDNKIKKRLIIETDQKKYSVARLRERIREEKKKIDIDYISMNEDMMAEKLIAFDVQRLEYLKNQTLFLEKNTRKKLSLYQDNLQKIEATLASKLSKHKIPNIISASRCTDIPAFYSDWFFNRIKKGFVQVKKNIDMATSQKISLAPKDVQCLVFWTKNPGPMMTRIDELKAYLYYFHFTLTPYDQEIKPFLPPTEKLIKIFIQLSNKIGKEKVIWRYDPVFLTDKIDIEYHNKHFSQLASRLKGYTDRCIIRFIDSNQIPLENKELLKLKELTQKKIRDLGNIFQHASEKYGIKIEACTEKIDLSGFGISPGKCVDDKLINTIMDKKLFIGKDLLRPNDCGCVKSVDIGIDNTCSHGCLFCYATKNQIQARVNYHHDKDSPLLMGKIADG